MVRCMDVEMSFTEDIGANGEGDSKHGVTKLQNRRL